MTTTARRQQLCGECLKQGHNRIVCPQKSTPNVIAPSPNSCGQFLIYALVDPRREDRYRFIGKTATGIERARGHISRARYESSAKATWIRSLMLLGLNYKVIVLETTTADILEERHKWWLQRCRFAHPLTNRTRKIQIKKPSQTRKRPKQRISSGIIAGMSGWNK